MEDTPLHQWRLGEHLGLNFSIELSRALLDIHFIWSSRTWRTHDEVASIIFVSSGLDRSFLEFDVPVLGLLFALVVSSERLEQIGALFYLLLGSGVNDLSEIFHESEVWSHLVSQTCQLAQFWYQSHLIASLSILVNEERLVNIGNILIVPRFVVLHVADLLTILFKRSFWRHIEFNTWNFVRFLVVSKQTNNYQ